MSGIKFKKPLAIMLSFIMVFNLIPMTAFSDVDNTPPYVVSGSETQSGMAVSASVEGKTDAVPYEEDMGGWFEDADGDKLTYVLLSAEDDDGNNVESNIVVTGSAITYTPDAGQAGKTVTVEVKANDGTADSNGKVTITIAVGAEDEGLLGEAETNNPPAVAEGKEIQNGTASPADGETEAVPYEADMSGWFDDADGDSLTYAVVSAADGSGEDVKSAVTVSGSAITYTPDTAQAGKIVTIAVKANDGKSDSTGNVTVIISVGAGDETVPYTGQEEDGNYTISTPEQLAELAEKVNDGTDYSGSTFTLTKDIDLSAVCGPDIEGSAVSWTPIGSSSKRFGGTFDGRGYKISSLYIDAKADYQGIFGSVKEGGVIQNLTVSGKITTASNSTGGIVGNSMGKIINCLSDVEITVTGGTNLRVGGIVGYVTKTWGMKTTPVLQSCVNTGQMTIYNATGNFFGAISGSNWAASACYTTKGITPAVTYSGISGTLVTADQLKTGKLLWSLNTVDGTQAYSNSWTADKGYIATGKGTRYYRVRIMNISKDVTLSFLRDGANIDSYEEGAYRTVYVPSGKLTIASSETEGFTFDDYDGLTKNADGSYILQVSSDSDLSCGYEGVLSKVAWYTKNPSAETFTINTADQLVGLRMLVSGDISDYGPIDFSNKTVKLGADVDLSGLCSEEKGNWIPIGTAESPFSGTFDGAGCVVDNLYINSTEDNLGLFGYAKGNLTNITVGGTVSGENNIGAVAGIADKELKNCISTAEVRGMSNVGGVVGNAENTKVTACIYYNETTPLGIAGSAGSQKGCYYLSDQDIEGAVGVSKTEAEFKSRAMAYLMDTVSGSHSRIWQAGDKYPVIGNKTLYKVSIKPDIQQPGKSVRMSPETPELYTDESQQLQYAYITADEQIMLTVESDDTDYLPSFRPAGLVKESSGVYTAAVSSEDISLSYIFALSIAADTRWYDESKDEFILTTEGELRGLASMVNSGTSFEGKTISLGNDIVVEGGYWPIIGNKAKQFSGTFDGKNHTVSGFLVKTDSTDENIYNYQGFFGYIGSMSTVKNLKLEGIVADGKQYCGILAGYADNYCTISNCVTDGNVYFKDNAQNTIRAGGMAGGMGIYGIITDCVNNAGVEITVDINSSNVAVSGLIGYLEDNCKVTSCINNGKITYTVEDGGTTDVSPMVGGIVGLTDNNIEIISCVNNGPITVTGIRTGNHSQASLGGISGSSGTVFINDCRNSAKITCGLINSASKAYAGGIIGGSNSAVTATSDEYSFTVKDCVNTGIVEVTCQGASNTIFAGGIAGGTGIMLSAITGCSNSGNVVVTSRSGEAVTGGNSGVGGIIGSAFNPDANAEISKCFNSGTVSAAVNYLGGIVGRTVTGLLMTDCYNISDVTGTDYVGGIAGNLACSLQSSFNYGGSVTSTSGSNAGLVVGSGASADNVKSLYYLADTGFAGVETPSDAGFVKAKTSEEFKSFDLVYELNSIEFTAEDRCVWEQGEKYPQVASKKLTPVYEIKTASGENGAVQNDKHYLPEGESYTITFVPESGYILKSFIVTGINSTSYRIYLNSFENGVYSVTMKDAEGNICSASLEGNVLTGTMSGHSLTFAGEFVKETAGPEQCNITLYGNGGWWGDNKENNQQSLKIGSGKRLTLADIVQPDGYKKFEGWYVDAEGTTPFNFSSAITADTDLYSKWDENSCVAYYKLNGGSWSLKDYTAVLTGGRLEKPSEVPVKAGYKFTGWYSDEACLNPFNFNTAVIGDVNLYAGWIAENYYQVIFDANGGAFKSSETRIQLSFNSGSNIGSAVDEYAVSNGDMKLRGWYTSPAGGSRWTLDNELTEDLILYAHWDKADGTPTIYSGTEEAPMEIEDISQLVVLRDNVNSGNPYEGCYFKMAADLALPTDWVPVGALKPGADNDGQGANIYPFSGTFDGGDRTITIPEGELPLFGYVREAKIQNLNIYGKKIAGYGLVNKYTTDYGADGNYNVGTGGSFTAGCPDTVDIVNVTLKSGSSTLYSGFIGGYASGGNTINIYNCTVESGVVIGYSKSEDHIGSFVGWYSGTIDNCVSYASVYGNDYVGGMAGQKGQSMGFFTVKNSAFSGKVEATGDYAGGIVGGGYDNPTAPNTPCVSILNCYVDGSVTGSRNVGGIFGGEPICQQAWANGIGYIQNNYFGGSVTASKDGAYLGAVIGYMRSLDRYNIIENNYYLNTSAAKGIGKIEEIDDKSTYYGRTEPFVEEEVCIPANSEELASGKIAALLNSGNNSSKIWTQSGGYPVLGTAETAVYTVKLSITGAGAASVTGITTEGTVVYQKAGSTVEVSAEAEEGYQTVKINVLYEDGTSEDITSAGEFTMKMQDASVNVVFAAEGEKYVESIAVASMPDKVSYSVGDSFDITGLTFTVTYIDGTAEAITATPDMVSGFSSATSGTKTLTITYQGAVTTFTVTVSEKTPGTIKVSFRLIGATLSDGDIDLEDGDYKGSKYITWIKTRSYKLPEGSTVYDLFTKALDDAGIDSLGADQNYVRTIYAPSVLGEYKLSEFTNGKYSGWMYTVNGSHPNQGLQYWELEDGDKVIWHYVNDFRYEVHDWEDTPEYPSLGNSSTWSKWLKAADVPPKADMVENGENSKGNIIAHEVKAVNGAASVSVSDSDIKSAIEYVKKNSGSDIVIEPEITGTAKKVSIEIPKESIASVASETSADLTVKSSVGNVTIPNGTLAQVTSQLTGGKVTINLEKVDDSLLTEEQKDAVGDSSVYNISITDGKSSVSSFGDSRITISLSYTLKDGEDPGGVSIWYLNDKGELEKIDCTYDKDTGLATFSTNHLSYYVVGYSEVWQNQFTDVNTSDWYYKYVEFVVKNGLFNGTEEAIFSPDTPMTRAMLVTVLYRMEGMPDVAEANSFIDVKSGEWYAKAVIWANDNNIVTGYGNGLFGAEDNITRQQLAAILYRYSQYKGYDLKDTAEISLYTDAGNISQWAQNAMKWAKGTGLIEGRTAETLAPEGNATRAEVAAITMRFMENFINK